MLFALSLFHLPFLIPLATAISVPEAGVTAPPQLPPTVNILVCGDSISQGREFDFTWRYRLWEWFHANALAQLAPTLQFVGPYLGTFPEEPRPFGGYGDPDVPPTWGAYHPDIYPAFPSAHFALYGRPAWQVLDVLQAQVEAFQPDIVVLHLGFNDMAWWEASPAELVERMAQLVFNARLGRSDVGVLVADVSSRLLVEERGDLEGKTKEYNALLAAQIGQWATPESPVVLVRVSEEYDCHVDRCPAGIDGLHPNALGEYQIAHAYSRVLHEFYHIGIGPLVIPPISTFLDVEWNASDIVDLGAPVWIYTGVGSLCLFVVVVLWRYWTGGKGRGKTMYTLLPSSMQADM